MRLGRVDPLTSKFQIHIFCRRTGDQGHIQLSGNEFIAVEACRAVPVYSSDNQLDQEALT